VQTSTRGKNFSEVEKSALGQENMRGLGVWTLTFFGVDGKNFQSPKHRPARDALPSSENPRQEGQPTRESHLSDSRKVGSRHCQRPSGRLTLPVEDGARVHRRFLGGILT
ncbi:unnamed protein product, partial [Clavelina lepadiformis]